jgi:hypothetical protein
MTMNKKQRRLLGGAFLLPMLAAGVFAVLGGTSLNASGVCFYQGEQYSEGACAYTACLDPEKAQQCTWSGWTSCAWCDEPANN